MEGIVSCLDEYKDFTPLFPLYKEMLIRQQQMCQTVYKSGRRCEDRGLCLTGEDGQTLGSCYSSHSLSLSLSPLYPPTASKLLPQTPVDLRL